MEFRIISIGTLSRHELWEKPVALRTAHATTTLIQSGEHVILVDPALPDKILTARLSERAGIEPGDVTDVFLTNFRPAHRMGLMAFDQARWLISGMEREFVGTQLIEQLSQTEDQSVEQILKQDISLLKKCQPASDRIAKQVDLFPLPGFTPGTCGLLLNQLNSTTLIAGDAVATQEHLEQGRILRGAMSIDQAKESLVEALEIADVIIPGHDNILLNPSRRPF